MIVPLALASFLFFGSASHRHELNHHQRFGYWTIRTRSDNFSSQTFCHITARSADYVRGTVTLYLGRKIDTSTAVLRIDHGRPLKASVDIVELAKSGVAVYNDTLDNPSGGMIRVSDQRVVGAHVVEVEPKPGSAVTKFNIDGLKQALAFASVAGCAVGN